MQKNCNGATEWSRSGRQNDETTVHFAVKGLCGGSNIAKKISSLLPACSIWGARNYSVYPARHVITTEGATLSKDSALANWWKDELSAAACGKTSGPARPYRPNTEPSARGGNRIQNNPPSVSNLVVSSVLLDKSYSWKETSHSIQGWKTATNSGFAAI